MINVSKNTVSVVITAIFTAIILILAFTPSIGYIPLGFTQATIVHIPVILGSILLGAGSGAFLGGIFGLTSLIMATIYPTVTSFVFSPFYSIGEIHGNFLSVIVCFLPRILVGVLPYYIFKLMKKCVKSEKHSETVALLASGVVGSLTNTVLVMSLIFLFFREGFAQVNQVPMNALFPLILSIVCINGIPEAILAAIVTCALGKILLRSNLLIK